MAFLDQTPALGYPLAAGMGLLVGSFLNVVILRLPRRLEWEWKRDSREILGEPALYDPPPPGIVVERSHCPHCGHQRSEEHTSELPSLMRISYAALCLKKKTSATSNLCRCPEQPRDNTLYRA